MAHRNLPGRDGQRRASGKARALPAQTASAGNLPSDNIDTLLALAREAGLLVTLDGQIGREKYQSVAGLGARVATVRRGTLRAGRTRRAGRCRATSQGAPRLAAREPPAQPHVQRVRRCMSGISVRGCAALPADGTTCGRCFASPEHAGMPLHGTGAVQRLNISRRRSA